MLLSFVLSDSGRHKRPGGMTLGAHYKPEFYPSWIVRYPFG